jgi:hypothetical protein
MKKANKMDEKDIKNSSGAGANNNKHLRDIDKVASNVSSWWGNTFVFVTKTKVQTWKGVLLVSFFSGLVIATVWGISSSYFQGSLAGAATSLFFDTGEADMTAKTVQVGDTFDLDAVIDTDNEDVVAVKAMITYDEANFSLNSIDTSGSIFAAGNSCQYQGKACEIIERDDANGSVTITLAKPSPGINTGTGGVIATLTFTALSETAPGSANFSFVYSSFGNYADSDMIADDGNGTDTLDNVVGASVAVTATPPPTCTSFTYSAYGACQPNNTQSRTVVSSLPSGCTGGNPELTQSCVYTPPTCTSFTYSAYGACQPNNTQSRTVVSSLPSGCTGGNPELSQSCVYDGGATTCTSFTYSGWAECQPNDTQTRTVASSLPGGCSGGNPVLSQSCSYVAPITNCSSFVYSAWETCDNDGIQARSVISGSPEGCTGGSPVLEQDCIPGGDSDPDPVEITDKDRPIKVEGDKKNFGKKSSFYSDDKSVSFQGGNSDIANGKVKILEDGDVKKEITVGADGNWKSSYKVKKDGSYKFKVAYFDSNGAQVAESSEQKVKVDTTDPKFTDLPLALSKKRGEKIWWKAEDEDDGKIDHFEVSFRGKKKETEKYSFNVPADAPRGLHILKVRIFDKAGNTTTRRVTILVK